MTSDANGVQESGLPGETEPSSERRTGGTETGTLGKAMAVLELVVMADTPLRFTDIHMLSGQPRGTLHRQLSHLVSEGLLIQRPDLAYEPGMRLLTFAHRAWSRNDLRSIARPHLNHLHEVTGETVHLGMLRGEDIIYLDKVESRQTVRMESQVGKISPAYCTGLGKAALSALALDDLEERLSRIVFHPFTASTHRSRQSLIEDLERIRLRGYAVDAQEHEHEICCVAAPIRTAQPGGVGGISVTGPAYRVTAMQLEAWSKLVIKAAGCIARDAAIALGPGFALIL